MAVLGQHPFLADAPFDGGRPANFVLGYGGSHRAILRVVGKGLVSVA